MNEGDDGFFGDRALDFREAGDHAAGLVGEGEALPQIPPQGLRDLPAPSLEEARAYAFDEEEEALRAAGQGRMLIGETARVAEKVREIANKSGADEVMALTGVHDQNERKRSYDRLVAALT